VGVAEADAVAKDEPPDALDADGLAGLIAHVVDEAAGVPIERGNRAVAQIGDQQGAAESAEARRRDRHPPRRVELSGVEVTNEATYRWPSSAAMLKGCSAPTLDGVWK